MVKRIIQKTKSVLFADPKLLYKEDFEFLDKDFYFQGGNDVAILLLHGWSTTSYEIRRVGQYLNESGYTVYGPMLSGHGTVPKDLEDFVYTDWIRDAQDALDKLLKTHKRVYVGGTSMGANLALSLAKERSDIEGLILMATPYKLRFEKMGELATIILSKFKRYHTKFYPPTFGLSTTITRLISYQSYPIKSVIELGKLVKLSRKNLEKISQPCLILQSAHDHIVSKNSADKIYDQISSKIKKKRYIQKAYHTFISDIRNDHVFKDILEFVNEVEKK
ncbi:alpha/beta hydrolase [Patescibacteria group bacterium]